MNWLAQLPTQRTPWLLFTGIVFLLEVTALFFQYQMGLAPCIMCIYQRTAVLGLLGAGIIGATKPQSKLVRAIAYLVCGVTLLHVSTLKCKQPPIPLRLAVSLSQTFLHLCHCMNGSQPFFKPQGIAVISIGNLRD